MAVAPTRSRSTTTPARAQTFNINLVAPGEVGVFVDAGNGPGSIQPATTGNAQVIDSGVADIVINLGNAGDQVEITGNLAGTGVATHIPSPSMAAPAPTPSMPAA